MAWHRALLGVLLVGAVAVAGIALNFTLLRLTQDANDPVGKLSPRAVFARTTVTTDAGDGQARTEPAAPAQDARPAETNDHDRDD